MSNFEYLKNFNEELYEIGVKLEEDTINSPRAVTADATLFLETLVKDIYKKSNNKLENKLMSFYKKVDGLYRSGAISYIYKNKLQDAYSLRNRIHENHTDTSQEKKLALELHQRLYYISKKYFQDYCDREKFITVPDYTKPAVNDIHFKNCIICGNEKYDSLSNMCRQCNDKIENANQLLSFKNTANDRFTRHDMIKFGLNESESISILMNLSKENVIVKKGDYYIFNEDGFKKYIDEINQYIKINDMLIRFYRDETTISQIKNTMEYWKGSINQKPYVEFYNLVTAKLENDFEHNLLKFEDIKKSMKLSNMDQFNISKWFKHERELFVKGNLNDAFILYNELLTEEFFNLKRKGIEDKEILSRNIISIDIYEFWKNDFMGDDFFKKITDIKKEIIIREVKKNNYLNHALKTAGVSRREFKKLYTISKKADDSFYYDLKNEYTLKRQKLLVKNLKNNPLNKTLRMCRITNDEFLRWYFKSESNLSEFYLNVSEILMGKYLHFRKNGWNKQYILKHLNLTKDIFNSWNNHPELDIFKEFKKLNKQITEKLVKRGMVINALKEGKSKNEAIASAGFTHEEFTSIYDASKKENSDFYKRFDREYIINRKKLFTELIRDNDFYNAIEKSDISQIEFNRWYLKHQDNYISSNIRSEFYLKTTHELMDKYLKARWNGKNKPDAARSVGLSNLIIDKWLKHTEFDIFYDFYKKNKQLTIDLIVKGFNEGNSIGEVSEKYDIPLKTIKEFIELGKVGHIRFEEVYKLYEDFIIPKQFKVFINDFKNKTFNKSLKHSKLTKEELTYYYELGKNGDDKFRKLYEELLDLKIKLYIDNILLKKSSRIAMKNSALSSDELKNHKSLIDKRILDERVSIISDLLLKNNRINGIKLAKAAGISVEELYDWYFKGKNGEDDYKEAYLMIEFGMIFPRVMDYKNSLRIGLPKNWLHKQFKKELGVKDYNIWVKHDFFNKNFVNDIKIDGEIISEDDIGKLLDKCSFKRIIQKNNDNPYEFLKKAFYGNRKFGESVVNVSPDSKIKISKKKIPGE